MTEKELKSCPFCGGEAKLVHGFPGKQKPQSKQAFVRCKNCGAKIKTVFDFPYAGIKEVSVIVCNSEH